MPLTAAPLPAPNTGPALAAPLPANAHAQVSNAVGQVNAGNMFGQPGTIIANVFGWRVDLQNSPGNQVNVSVQRNGVNGVPSTIASVFVPTNLNIAPPPPNNQAQVTAHAARVSELERVTRNGLEQSFASYAQNAAGAVITRFQVTGTFSA